MQLFKQFQAITYLPINFLGFNLDYTNSSFILTICFVILLCTYIYLYLKKSDIGVLYMHLVQNIIKQNATEKALFATPFMSAMFSMIMLSNVIGLVPGAFTPTSQFITNFTLACKVLLYILFSGIRLHGRGIIKLFIPDVPLALKPLMFIIEVFSFAMKSISLSMRLTVNMCVGHIVMKIFLMLSEQFGYFGVLIWPVYIFLLVLELFIALLQAYIFVSMSCIYMRDAVECNH